MATTMNAPLAGADYETVFGSTNMKGAGVSDVTRDRLVREEHARLARQGFELATIVNLLPFALSVNLGELGMLEVPAATAAEPEKCVVISHYRISMRDGGDARFTPVAVLPVELAREVEREYTETGGVFWFRGDGAPPEAKVEEAREKMFAWFRRIHRQGVDAWGRYHQHSMLTDRMRDAARALFSAGEIAELPEWITVTRAMADRRDCPMCGESIRTIAKICHFCHTRLDGADASWQQDEEAHGDTDDAVTPRKTKNSPRAARGEN